MIMGMDQFYIHRTKLDCQEKDIECLDDNGENKILQRNKNPTSMNMITAMQAKCNHRKVCVLFLVHISNDKGKDVENA